MKSTIRKIALISILTAGGLGLSGCGRSNASSDSERQEVKIEERNPEEVTHIFGKRIAPEGVNVFNPAFDITPHKYVTAIITERGVLKPPYSRSLKRLWERVDRE